MNRITPTAIVLMLLSSSAIALPDDRYKDLAVDASSLEGSFDEGQYTYYGEPGNPAVITQGSLRVEGDIIEQLSRKDEPTQLISTGTPARFQQQPEIDGGILYGSAIKLTYSEGNNLATLEENASISLDGNTLTGYYVEYEIDSRKGRARGLDTNDLVHIEITQNGETTFGSANTASFDDIAGIVILEGNATLKRRDNSFTGHLVEYNLKTNGVNAHRRDGDENDRINMTINPGSTE
jgi:lipopolysaccharide export system protein LptA